MLWVDLRNNVILKQPNPRDQKREYHSREDLHQRDITSDSVELCETEVCFWHIQFVKQPCEILLPRCGHHCHLRCHEHRNVLFVYFRDSVLTSATAFEEIAQALFSRSFVSLCPVGVTVTLPCGHKRLGLLLSDAVASHGNALKDLVQLVKLGFLPHDAVVPRRKTSMQQNRLVKSGLLPRDAAASQKHGRCGAESVDEARSHAERHSCIKKKCLEGAESVARLGLLRSDTAVSQRNEMP